MDKKSKVKSQKSKVNRTLRQRMINVTKMIKWIPEFGLDRELDWLKNMHDWLISKKRYWGLALPIYECSVCGKFDVIGGKEELKERAVEGWKDFERHTPHRPWVDKVKIKCRNCDAIISRVKDVGNPWLDAGIVPFSTISLDNQGEPLYKVDKKTWRKWFPADFITESFPGQFKNWFYSLIAMSAVLEDERPFKIVLGFGTLLAENGRPMHKSWGNAIEFNEGADRIGVDVMRWLYVTADPSKNLLFGYKRADQARRQFHLLLWNIYSFFVLYANQNKWKKSDAKAKCTKLHILDKWIKLRLDHTLKVVEEALKNHDAMMGALELEEFVQDLSRWYIRRSRKRVSFTADDDSDKAAFLSTLYVILKTLTRILAPFTPFIAEKIYRNITEEESVHLTDWPELNDSRSKIQDSRKIIYEMAEIRKICELGHAERKRLKIKVRQPLQKLRIVNCKLQIANEYEQLIKDELNVKNIELIEGKDELEVELDTKLTPELKAEGRARDIIRQIQIARKKAGCKLDKKIKVQLPDWPVEFAAQIKKHTLATDLIKGKSLKIIQ